MADVAANIIAALHIAYFLFIVGGTFAIVVPPRPWWVRSWTFRIAHLVAVYIVLAENALQIPCILNVAQWSLRTASVGAQEARTGIGGLLDTALFHTIPGSALNVMYDVLGILLPVLLLLVPPRQTTRARKTTTAEQESSAG
ncbi:MAG TPA: DUF2784 family protein [Vicinamibacterales bacterium]|nr:DUF2784 family protein [Vicinamibacterales bacterium]